MELPNTEDINPRRDMDSNDIEIVSILSIDSTDATNSNDEGMSKIVDGNVKQATIHNCNEGMIQEISEKLDNFIFNVENNFARMTTSTDQKRGATECKCGNATSEKLQRCMDTHTKQIETIIRNIQHHNASITRLLKLQNQISKQN